MADVRAGGIYYTGSNEVRLARFPVPAGYTHFQITEDDDPGALGSWSSTSAVPDSVIFSAPAVNTNVMLYAWFTNTSDTVALKQTLSRIVYTDVVPAAAARAALLPYRRLAVGGVATVTGADLDRRRTGRPGARYRRLGGDLCRRARLRHLARHPRHHAGPAGNVHPAVDRYQRSR